MLLHCRTTGCHSLSIMLAALGSSLQGNSQPLFDPATRENEKIPGAAHGGCHRVKARFLPSLTLALSHTRLFSAFLPWRRTCVLFSSLTSIQPVQQSFNQRSKEHFAYSGGPQRQLSACALLSLPSGFLHGALSCLLNTTGPGEQPRLFYHGPSSMLGLSLNPGQCWAKGWISIHTLLLAGQLRHCSVPQLPHRGMDRAIRGFLVGSEPEAGHTGQVMTPIRHCLPSNTVTALAGPIPSKKLQITSIHRQAGAVSCSTGGRAVGALTTISHSSTENKAMTQQPARALEDHPTPHRNGDADLGSR